MELLHSRNVIITFEHFLLKLTVFFNFFKD